MRIIVSKILNRTDLGQSGSHGGLVVTKSDQNALKDFFGVLGKDREFVDRRDSEKYMIHYQDYTSNGITPNDRITPIGKYASKHSLQPGDILMFEKTEKESGREDYYIEYARKLDSAFFKGKSKTTVEILNYEQLVDIFTKNITVGTIKKVSATEFEMSAVYMGVNGTLKIIQNAEEFELFFNEIQVSENKKYFELDMSVTPFILRKTETWRIAIDGDLDEIVANKEADDKLIDELADIEKYEGKLDYKPVPETKAPETESKGRKVPARNRVKAEYALARADYKCEVGDHKTFLRKKNLLPYTEPHHLIPLQYDKQFEHSLDVEANIVSLCSNCHNRIHYGASIEKMIRQLWEQRKDELKAAGLCTMRNGVELTVEILLSFYGIE